jgi:hypothetical protein
MHELDEEQSTLRPRFRETIDEPWLSVEPIRLGKIPSGLGTPDFYVTATTPAGPIRIDFYSDSETVHLFQDAIIWENNIVIGYADRLTLIEFDNREVRTIHLEWHFGSLRVEDNFLLVASASRLRKLSSNGDVAWTSEELGVDGVVIDKIENGIIAGQGEWDPPGGWRPFTISLDSGQRLS